MRRLLWIPLLLVALAIPVTVLAGSGEGFNAVVNSLESRYHAQATRIPMMGLVSLIARAGSHGQVANLHVAEFDHFTESVDSDDVNRLVAEKMGAGWERIVRETSHHGQKTEQSFIFMRAENSRIGLFILDLDGHELDVVQLSIDPTQLGHTVHTYTHHNDNSDTDHSGSEVSD